MNLTETQLVIADATPLSLEDTYWSDDCTVVFVRPDADVELIEAEDTFPMTEHMLRMYFQQLVRQIEERAKQKHIEQLKWDASEAARECQEHVQVEVNKACAYFHQEVEL